MAASFLGTLPGWLTVAAVVILAIAMRGGAVGPALGYLRETNTALNRENTELKKQVVELAAEIVTLQHQTNLEPMQLAVVEAIEQHERASARRDQSLLRVIEMIAGRLGPDANGG